ncbi:MAG: MBL fold metallo-hydrolase, partial [Saprospiraceae bacterium]|nr:MBL fold metallo-hydrolase [Saprospiraceae bacterium]
LGTGTSQGVPVIGCSCQVCKSDDPRDARLRTSAMVQSEGVTIVIDVGPDFRQQLLSNPVDRLDAVLITHEHNDHVIGLDDIRPFYFRQREGIHYYATGKVFKELQKRFPYAFEQNPYPGAPKITMQNLTPLSPFKVKHIEIVPFKVIHGQLEVMCFRIGNLAYITDASEIPKESMKVLEGVDTLIINALRKESHYSHFNLNQALKVIDILRPRQSFLTHISHYLGLTEEVQKELPHYVNVGYDNLVININ